MRRLMYTTNALEGTALRAPFGSKASLYYYLYI
jgi:hypothetical protein